MQKLKILEIKNAILHDEKFRTLFPELEKDFQQVISNPSCACNTPVYKKVLEYPEKLKIYFPTKEIISQQEEINELSKNNWSVINCKSNELEKMLNSLHKYGRKQIAVARYEDEITIIVNDLGVIF